MKTLVFIIILSLLSDKIYPQSSGEIAGKVIDKSNQQPLTDVTVSVIQNEKIIHATVACPSEFSEDSISNYFKNRNC